MSATDIQPVVQSWIMSTAATSSEHAILIVSKDGQILHWLGACERIFGYSQDEAAGMAFERLFTPEDVERGLDKHERALTLSAGRSEDDRWHVRKDGSRFWGSGVMETIRDDAGAVVALTKVMRDRTDVRTQTEALQNRLQAAEDSRARLREFLLSTGHELRNQLTPILTSVEMLDRAPTEESRQKARETLRRGIGLMSTLLNDLMDFNESAAGKTMIRPVRLEVQAAIRQVALGYSAAAAARRQDLKVTVPEAPIVVEADPARVEQMLANLVSNACKYTQEGGTIELSATVEADMAVIRVEDNGIGISGDVLPHIFELFTREHPTQGPKGLGVGLSVVKQLASAHGGMIEARSPGPGKGSVFTIRLPLPGAASEQRSAGP